GGRGCEQLTNPSWKNSLVAPLPTGIRRTPRQSRDVLQAASQASALVHGPGGRDRVELVCVVENRRLGGFGRAQVVMHSDRVQELGPNISFERRRPVLDQPENAVDVAEPAALLGLPEARSRPGLEA